MKFRTLSVVLGLLFSLCIGAAAFAQTGTKARHSAAWYKKHSKHSAAWYKKHGHSAAWFKKHSKHSAAWYKKHG